MRGRFVLVACCGLLQWPALAPAGDRTIPASSPPSADHLRDLQAQAVQAGVAEWGHWGLDAARYSAWGSHSNRLIPIYSFGMGLESVSGPHSVYRSADKLKQLYGRVPQQSLNPKAEYFDQTDVYRLQKIAADSGKKYVILLVFDGMDWQTTWAAATYRAGKVTYREGRGAGLLFQDYRQAPTDFGFFVTSPANTGTGLDVDRQWIRFPGIENLGGYDPSQSGETPWAIPPDPKSLLNGGKQTRFAYTDSAASATSMCSGIKSYNEAINVTTVGRQVVPIARDLQDCGYSVGIVTSVPISHATPAAMYANNVTRDDYQDLTRDMLGLASISHPGTPLPGVDVLLGAGWGEKADNDKAQGTNFVPGNKYIAPPDLERINANAGGPYIVVQRATGIPGKSALAAATEQAIQQKRRLFGLFGAKGGHLPYRTADGRFDPTFNGGKDDKGVPHKPETYTPADIEENPTLADLTTAALKLLDSRGDRFWLGIEAGDVDWANHANNLDSSVGAVLSGDEAFRAIVDWVESKQAWDRTVVLVTADHGHYLVLEKPERLASPSTDAK